jgi:vancomycin resistance protein YoaR
MHVARACWAKKRKDLLSNIRGLNVSNAAVAAGGQWLLPGDSISRFSLPVGSRSCQPGKFGELQAFLRQHYGR